MRPPEGLEIEVRQDVAVHDQKILAQVTDKGERPDRAQRRVFDRVVDLEPPAGAVAEKNLDQLRQNGQTEMVMSRKPTFPRRTSTRSQDGLVAHRQERLGQNSCVRVQPGCPCRQPG